MGMPEGVHRWTRDEVQALPEDGNRYELIDGELLVSPSPQAIHQRAVLELFRLVDPYVRSNRVGATGLAPADLDLGAGHLVQPDLFVVPLLPNGKEPLEWAEFGVPLLIAEVISPSTARYDRTAKRRLYQRRGVAQYWIVDTDARTIERWEPDDTRPEILEEEIRWQPARLSEALVIALPDYFRAVWDEASAASPD